MKREKLSFDTGIIIAASQEKTNLKKISSKWTSDNYELVISTKVEWEAIRLLSRHPFYLPENEAKQKVRKVIDNLGLKRYYKTKIDETNGQKLIEKYGKHICHYPDSTIIAHLKRISVKIVITIDGTFKNIAEKEGLRAILISFR